MDQSNKRNSSGKYFLALAAMSVIVFNQNFVSQNLKSGGEHLVQLTQTTEGGGGVLHLIEAPQTVKVENKVVLVRRPAVSASSTEIGQGGWDVKQVMAMQAEEQAQRLAAENNLKEMKTAQLERQALLTVE